MEIDSNLLKPGKVLTLAELKNMPYGSVIHIKYEDEDGNEREDGFQFLKCDDMSEWCAGAFPIPLNELDDEDSIKDVDNCGWHFTIREAVPSKYKIPVDKDEVLRLLNKMGNIKNDYDKCDDDYEAKRLCREYNKRNRQLMELTGWNRTIK